MVQYWNRRLIFWCVVALAACAEGLRADERVTIEPGNESLTVRIHDQEFTVFHFGRSLPKPYFWPVRASDGAILTRPIEPGEKDHPHHRGVWLSVDEVNDIKFWAERGKIAVREVTSKSGNPATIELKNDWLGRDGTPVMIERTKISIFSNRLMVYDVVLSPPAGQIVRFDDTKEGFFGIRVAQSMRELEGGVVVNSEGGKTTKECWGRTANWVDYTGMVDGKQYGVALMDHPANFRRSRYHVRDYGLFSLSPFGEGAYQNDKEKSQAVILDDVTPSLQFRYGLFIHDSDASSVAGVYDQFLKATEPARQ